MSIFIGRDFGITVISVVYGVKSIIYYLSSVKRFCAPDQILNMGPTKHNVMCKGKSALDVILGHDDFLQQRGRSLLTPAESIEDKRRIDPEIKVVSIDDNKFLLISTQKANFSKTPTKKIFCLMAEKLNLNFFF